MNHRRSLLVALALLLALVTRAVAAESKFSLTKYIPFMGKSNSADKSSSTRSQTAAKRATTVKKTDHAVKTANHKKSSEPSAWQKFTSGTKATFAKLNPWSGDKSKTKKTTSPSADRPKTVSEFIKQPRPE